MQQLAAGGTLPPPPPSMSMMSPSGHSSDGSISPGGYCISLSAIRKHDFLGSSSKGVGSNLTVELM